MRPGYTKRGLKRSAADGARPDTSRKRPTTPGGGGGGGGGVRGGGSPLGKLECLPSRGCTLGGKFQVFKGRKSVILGVWAAPGARETIPLGGGLRPPPFGRVSRAAGAAQIPKMTDFRSLFPNQRYSIGVLEDPASKIRIVRQTNPLRVPSQSPGTDLELR